MDLRSSENFWPLRNGIIENYPSLQSNTKADVAIIGAGISGALMADALSRAGFDVVILDKRHAGFGSTSASTALIQYEIDTPLRELIKKVGVDHAVRSYKLCVDAIGGLKKICSHFEDQCDFKLKPSFQYTSFKSHLKDHQKEMELRQLHGISKTHWLSPSEIKNQFGFKKDGGLYSEDGAVLDPFKLTHYLLRSKDLRVYDNTEVVEIQHKRNGVTLKCHTGFSVQAKKLIIASGYESQKYIKKRVEIPKTTYAILSEPMEDKQFWHKDALIWETADPYLYLRTTADKRILVGGLDDPSHNPRRRDSKLPKKARELEEEFKKLFPKIKFATDFSWAGIFCGTKDGLPYIGSIPEHPHTYFSLGFGGNGITYSLIAAQIITDLVSGKKNEDAKVFTFQR